MIVVAKSYLHSKLTEFSPLLRFECLCNDEHLLAKREAAGVNHSDLRHIVVAHTGLEPVVSALRGQRVSRLHQCAAADWHYRFAAARLASFAPIVSVYW
jgi:hypothetical protein